MKISNFFVFQVIKSQNFTQEFQQNFYSASFCEIQCDFFTFYIHKVCKIQRQVLSTQGFRLRCDVRNSLFFQSSPHFIQSVKQKMNSDHVFSTVWSGFSFFYRSKFQNSLRSVIFHAISHNRKSICEVRAFEELQFKEERTEANCFFVELN